jgi:hypothetical protein
VRTPPGRDVRADVDRIERRITATLRTWSDGLRDELRTRYAPERAFELGREFGDAFPVAYQEDLPAPSAIPDIEELLALPADAGALGLQLRGGEAARKALHLRLYRRSEPLAMSTCCRCSELRPRILNERRTRSRPRVGGSLDPDIRSHAGGRHRHVRRRPGSMKRSSRSGRDAPKATVQSARHVPRGSTATGSGVASDLPVPAADRHRSASGT